MSPVARDCAQGPNCAEGSGLGTGSEDAGAVDIGAANAGAGGTGAACDRQPRGGPSSRASAARKEVEMRAVRSLRSVGPGTDPATRSGGEVDAGRAGTWMEGWIG